MTEQEQDEIAGRVLRDYRKARRDRAILGARLDEIRRTLLLLCEQIEKGHYGCVKNNAQLPRDEALSLKGLGELAAECEAAEDLTRSLGARLAELGVTL